MKGLLRWATFVLAFAWLLHGAGDAAAQKLYKWTDKDGKIHFSNVGPGGEGATDQSSSVTGIEAQTAQSGDTTEQPSTAAPPHDQATSGDSSSAISEEAFSLQASVTRSRLKRELAAAKEQSQQADDRLAALKQELNQPTRVDLQMLQKAYGPNQHVGSEEDTLRKQKKDADARIEDIRKQYADLHDQAVKLYGHQPSWWLPLE
jgi:chromosome segregation ATPase